MLRMGRFLELKRSSLGIITLLGITLVLLAVLSFRPVQPSYDGKYLEHWLIQLQSLSSLERTTAERAVREIGADAVPTLTAWLTHQDSEFEKRFVSLLRKFGVIQRDWRSENYYRSKAMCGFEVLGNEAASALPDLRQLIQEPEYASDAAFALLQVSPTEAERVATEWISGTNRLFQAWGLRIKQEIAEVQSIPVPSRRSTD